MPNVAISTIEPLLKVENEFSDFCIASMGLHPTSVDKNYKNQLDIISSILNDRRFISVGEIGIDLYWDKTFLKEQTEVFEAQIDWAINLSIPIIIHARESFAEIYSSLKKFPSNKLFGVFHSFSGTKTDVEIIKTLGNFYFGINGVITFKNSNLGALLNYMGTDRILLETDAPYLSPVPNRGKRNEPANLKYISEKISSEMNMPITEIIRITTLNAQKLFSILNV